MTKEHGHQAQYTHSKNRFLIKDFKTTQILLLTQFFEVEKHNRQVDKIKNGPKLQKKNLKTPFC